MLAFFIDPREVPIDAGCIGRRDIRNNEDQRRS
jgi:hypothetical protein